MVRSMSKVNLDEKSERTMRPEKSTKSSRSGSGRKLSKRRPKDVSSIAAPRSASTELPDRFRDGDDAQEDVCAPKDRSAQYMGQSVFAMMAAAGSTTDFQSRFDDGSSSESDGDADGEEGKERDAEKKESRGNRKWKKNKDTRQKNSAVRKLDDDDADGDVGREVAGSTEHTRKQRKRLSERSILKALPKLRIKSSRGRPRNKGLEDASDSKVVASQSSSEEDAEGVRNDAPMMSRVLQAQAQMDASRSPSAGQSGKESGTIARSIKPSSLSQRLKEIFDFDDLEDVISEYPCWLLQSVLLQGYMYVTQKHVCFYAYLPKKSNVIVKSGYLAKRGRQNPNYSRYWFTLKGDVLSYHSNPAELYFPNGHIDLRYGISATVNEPKEKGKDSLSFSVTTDQRTYYFKADSAASAKDWVRQLQKVIFRSHNDGDSVKISLPIENVIDIEENPVVDFADTVKLRVIDNDETYAVDEYFFSFFAHGKDALNVLCIMINGSSLQKSTEDIRSARVEQSVRSPERRSSDKRKSRNVSNSTELGSPTLREPVRATLSPLSPAVGGSRSRPVSGEWRRSSLDVVKTGQRRSFDSGRRSTSTDRRDKPINIQRDRSSLSSRPAESSDSRPSSLDREANSSVAIQSIDDTSASASQILNRSDVFQSPTIKYSQRSQPSIEVSRHTISTEQTRFLDNASPTKGVLSEEDSQRQEPSQGTAQSSKASQETAQPRRPPMQQSQSSSALHDIVRASSTRASGIAGYIKTGSKRMSNLLATGPMGYYEKVSGMWVGGKRHFGDPEALTPDDQIQGPEDEEEALNHAERFRAHFGLPDSEQLVATYFGWLYRVLPLYGKIYLSKRKFCFRSLLPGTRIKLVLPLKDVENVSKEKGFRLGYSGLVIVIRGHEELFFEFNQSDLRDDCTITLLRILEPLKYLQESVILSDDEAEQAEAAKAEHQLLLEARKSTDTRSDSQLPSTLQELETDTPPIFFDDPRASIVNFKPIEPLRITCLTIGSRGDVQPYIALCKRLLAEGHRPKIATHREFRSWIERHGIEFAPVEGDPAELMRLCVENGVMTFSFLKEAGSKFRGWLDELLHSAWEACQECDLLVESPSAMAGIHIAEALAIPYYRAFTMPWTRTRAYPHAFAVPDHKMGGAYNYFSYVMFENVFWRLMSGQVNRWRRKELGLGSTTHEKLATYKVPFLYNFSPSVVVPPLDYCDWVHVTGYWFLDEADNWEPPADLLAFIRKAREDKKSLVYVGFGSIVVTDPAAVTRTVVDSIVKADVRCILSKGWSDRLDKKDGEETEIPLPREIFQIKSAPHDWLFRQMDVAVHHGGAGTTGASLRAGVPTIIKPFFGDQFFFGSRVEDLGVGICMKKINTSVFARALWDATHNERMITKARLLGQQIRKEDGVGTAIKAIYRDMEYSRSLIKRRNGQEDNPIDDFEESWTLVGTENDAELRGRLMRLDASPRTASLQPWTEEHQISNGGQPSPNAPAKVMG